MSGITLYNYFRSSTSYRVRIALYLKEISFEYKAINLLKDGGDQNKKEYRSVNPGGGVPSIMHNGQYISESRAIIEYLNDVFPTYPLISKDPIIKAKTNQICDHINTSMHPMGNLRVLQYLEKEFAYNLDQKEKWVQHWMQPALAALEEVLKDTSGKFCIGDSITIADLFLVPQVFTCQRFKVDMTAYENVMRINNECLKLDAFKKAHPFRQPDTPPELAIP
jgi:maleylacetoacetate isomerase